MRIHNFDDVLSFGDKLLGLRVYVPYEPCDRIGVISKVTSNSIIYGYFDVHRSYCQFRKANGRINEDNFRYCTIEHLNSMIVERNLQQVRRKDESG